MSPSRCCDRSTPFTISANLTVRRTSMEEPVLVAVTRQDPATGGHLGDRTSVLCPVPWRAASRAPQIFTTQNLPAHVTPKLDKSSSTTSRSRRRSWKTTPCADQQVRESEVGFPVWPRCHPVTRKIPSGFQFSPCSRCGTCLAQRRVMRPAFSRSFSRSPLALPISRLPRRADS